MPGIMTHSEDLRKFVQGWETLELEAYNDRPDDPDNGTWTIGYGHTDGVQPGDVCTEEQAEEWLDRDLSAHGDELDRYLDRDPTQQEWDALLSLAFNCGATQIGTSGLLARYNNNQDAEVVKRWPLWNKSRGKVLAGLVKRRAAEVEIFLSGNYSGRP